MQDLIGPIELAISEHVIDNLYKNGSVEHEVSSIHPLNAYFILRAFEDPQKTALARLTANNTLKLLTFRKDFSMCGIKPRDSKQYFFSDQFISH